MLELRLAQAGLLRKVLEATRELLTTANFDFSPTGVSLQAMDSSHVALVALLLTAAGFDRYRCDRPRSVGIHLRHLARFLRCAANDDLVTLKAHDDADSLTLLFESSNQDKLQDNEIKMMMIDSEHLGIPEAEYQATVVMPSQEFARLCRDLSRIGDSVIISVTKEGVKFSTSGDMGNANVIYRQHTSADKPEESIMIELSEPVTLSFALRYMNSFTKATPLSSTVTISMSSDLPMAVEYKIAEMGYIRYYLAPKVEEDEQQQ